MVVNAKGHTLYVFAPDKAKKVTCVGACAAIWPPLALSSGQKAGRVRAGEVLACGERPEPGGGRTVTYAGWPLYSYVTDTSPGSAHGQALKLNGGLWYVIAPSGKLITKKASTSTGGY